MINNEDEWNKVLEETDEGPYEIGVFLLGKICSGKKHHESLRGSLQRALNPQSGYTQWEKDSLVAKVEQMEESIKEGKWPCGKECEGQAPEVCHSECELSFIVSIDRIGSGTHRLNSAIELNPDMIVKIRIIRR